MKIKPYSEVIRDEIGLLEDLVENLKADYFGSPLAQPRLRNGYTNWPKTPSGKDKPAVYTLCNSLASAIGGENEYGEARKPPSIEEAEKWVLEILSTAQKRFQEVEETLADVERYNQAIQQAEASSKGLQNPELFSRYERHITQQLNEALDRLANSATET